MGDGTTNLAGIDIPSTNPVFLTVVGVHILLGLACTVTGAIAMLSQKRAGRHPRYGTIYFWCLAGVFLTAAGLAAVRWAEDYHLFILGSIVVCGGLFWAVKPDGTAGAIGSGCTSPEWERPTFCS